ncbi:DNA methyltransferase [Candidatus Parabeggiatoa sp. HSG14]|uniref:DNA methyltransferase n=1 Tax=Candidatus Parabeggiatoa sp. HSG14 TaxID=3055593 RepID=UPI0025A7D678|nr:DNA methyltransferase [Thiotrichales bacterium HSG14]
MNKLYLGDCLDVLRNELEIKPESVDLIYIDPPFNSKRNYNVFFDDKEIQTQRMAFEDTWSLHSVGDSLTELDTIHHDKLLNLLHAYRDIAPQVFPYLVMMTLRIIELHRKLKATGSFYLHCDPTASHYLKTVCDAVFGAKNFRNEITWKRTPFSGSSKSRAKQLPRNHDIILFYSKNQDITWNSPSVVYSEEYLKRFKWKDKRGYYRKTLLKTYSQETFDKLKSENRLIEPIKEGAKYSYKQYLNESKGSTLTDDIWLDINMLNPVAKERLGYPTQKPKALLERIIKASSNEGDVILDAFCGCGTTVDAAESLNRQWIGIDIAPFAISLIKRRLKDTYGNDLGKFEVRGTPTDEASAIKLWEQNPFAFEDWWLTELEIFATTYGKKGADKGIDGIGQYLIPKSDKVVKVAFQVKGGKVQSKDIDALMGVVALDKYDMGVLLTRHKPTNPMLKKATQAEQFEAAYGFNYPKIQIMTLAEFFSGKQLNLPKNNITFKSAATVGKGGKQGGLL